MVVCSLVVKCFWRTKGVTVGEVFLVRMGWSDWSGAVVRVDLICEWGMLARVVWLEDLRWKVSGEIVASLDQTG